MHGFDLKRSEAGIWRSVRNPADFLLVVFSRLEERHASQIKSMSKESEELRSQLSQMEKELQYLRTELEVQKEANIRSPSNTMKNLVERLKGQLALKEKQLKVIERTFQKALIPLLRKA